MRVVSLEKQCPLDRPKPAEIRLVSAQYPKLTVFLITWKFTESNEQTMDLPMFSLEGRSAIVTGASRGLGKA
jgi:hypothetical protein